MLDPKSDIVFRLLFGEPGNESLLRSMIEAVVVLPAPIAGLEVLNPSIPRDVAALEAIVLDIRVRCADGTLLDIEMETWPRAGVTDRFLYYWATLYTSQLARGEAYLELRRAISIVWMVGSVPSAGDRFHSTYHVAEDHSHGRLTDHMELHLLDLKRIDPREALAPTLDRWVRFLLAPTGAACKLWRKRIPSCRRP